MGNEENEEESQKDYQTNIKDNDINIIKFKAPNDYKSSKKNSKEQFRNYIKLIFFFVFLEAYMIFKYLYSSNNIKSLKKFLGVFNTTLYSYVNIVEYVDISKSYYFDNSIPIFYKKINNSKLFEPSPFYYTFYNLTDAFELMVISTSKTKSFLKDSYKDTFSSYIYQNFNNKMFDLNTTTIPNENLINLFENGFRAVTFNIFDKLRFFWIQNYKNIDNILNDKKWVDLDYLLLSVVRPWYIKLLEIIMEVEDNFLNQARLVQISVFIIVLAIFILCYLIIWKSYEESLSILLQRSFDLINLIPEEIKYLIVSKLNEY